MRRNGDKTTSGVKFDLTFDFSVPDFLYVDKFWKLVHDFMYFEPIFWRRNGQNSTSGQIFNPKFEIAMGYFLFEYEFWWSFRQDLYVFFGKNCFRNAKFSEFGGYWRWGWKFFVETPKKALPCLISRALSHRSCKSVHGFLLQASARKKGHYREVIFYVFAGNSPPNQIQPKLAHE